jgi:hypothetical protein
VLGVAIFAILIFTIHPRITLYHAVRRPPTR